MSELNCTKPGGATRKGHSAADSVSGTVVCDEESRFYYNRFRYYDPKLGRYITQDPIGLRGGFNGFIYPTNPVRRIDPLGLYAEVLVEGNDVTITFPMEYIGTNATPAKIAQMDQGITNRWSGKHGKYNVTAQVATPAPGCAANKKNTIDLDANTGRSNVLGVAGIRVHGIRMQTIGRRLMKLDTWQACQIVIRTEKMQQGKLLAFLILVMSTI